MNIFVLDDDIETCARYHNDRHVNKMILESAQMLSSAVRLSGIDCPTAYKLTHKNHGCTKWACESLSNWLWLRSLAFALGKEFDWRFARKNPHKSIGVIKTLPEPDIPDLGLTPFYQAMPERYRRENPVDAYRLYYICEKRDYFYSDRYGGRHHADSTWRRRGRPDWWWDDNKLNVWLTAREILRDRRKR